MVGTWSINTEESLAENIQESLRKNLQKCLENRNVPMWMAKGRTISMQKDKKGEGSKYLKTYYFPAFSWKLLTGVIKEKVYRVLDTNLLLPQEQKECRRKSRGTNDLMFIDDKRIIREVKIRK